MKGSLLLGTAHKKLGDVVFYRNGGEQQARVRVTPKNPQSLRQGAVRAITSTVATAYMWFKEICDHSFEGVQYGQMSQRKFFKLNSGKFMDLYRKSELYTSGGVDPASILSFNPKGDDSIMPNSYIVSTGTLPAFTSDKYTGPETVGHGHQARFLLHLNGWQLLPAEQKTWQKLAEYLGVPVGAQLTFITTTYDPVEGEGVYSYCEFGRLILEDNARRVDTPVSMSQVSPLNLNVTISHPADSADLIVDVGSAAGTVGCYGIIVSDFSTGEWKRSRCELEVTSQRQATSLLLAAQSYGKTSPDPTSTKYLNKSEDLV